jgi:hypothetical protein
MLVTTTALAMRAMYADLAYTSQRLQVIANREGNRFGIAIRASGAATALAAARLPSPRFNRVVGLNPAETASLQDILAWYGKRGRRPSSHSNRPVLSRCEVTHPVRLRDPLTVIDDHANDHSDTVPMRADAGDRMFATK